MDISATYESGSHITIDDKIIIYDHIEFRSTSLKRKWRRQLRGNKLEGTVRLKGKPLFDFTFNKKSCKIRFTDAVNGPTYWTQIDVLMALMD